MLALVICARSHVMLGFARLATDVPITGVFPKTYPWSCSDDSQVLEVGYFLVSQFTITCSKFKVADEIDIVLEEVFIRNSPSCRESREVTVLAVFRKFG